MLNLPHKHRKRYQNNILEHLRNVQNDCYTKHPACHPSIEHSLAVLLEEVDELKAEVYKPIDDRRTRYLELEAMHVAHCATRLLIDLYCRQEDGLNMNEHYTKAV